MWKLISVFLCVLCVGGCADITTSKLNNLRQSFTNDNFIESAENFSDGRSVNQQNNLELLITGLSEFQAKQYSQSDATFEEFNKRNPDILGNSILYETTRFVAGNFATEYKPFMMDSLFVSYYQILDAIGDKRRDDVRVIINQSYAKQQNMSLAYADLVQKTSEKIANENSELTETLQQNQSINWTAYTDIMNPALMYLSGIWFLVNGDYSDAQTYLSRTYGMSNGNYDIQTDLQLAETNKKPSNITWIFVESGFAPMLHQETLSIPVITKQGVIVTSIAVAKPVFWNCETSIFNEKPLADINAMFMTEFNQYNINNALRGFASASARTIAQAALYNSGSRYSGLFGMGATLFSVTTTDAEVRSWVTLPEKISVLRTKTADLIDLKLNDKLGTDISLPTLGNNLIYIRLTDGEPVIHIFKL